VPPSDGRLLPCGFGDSTPNSGAKAPGISRPVSPRRRPRAAPPNPRKGPETRRRRRDLGSSRSLGHLSTTVTRSNLGSRPASFGLAGSFAGPPASKPCSLENPFTGRPCSCPSLRPNAHAATGPLLSWDSAPLKSSTTTSGTGRPREHPASREALPDTPGRPRPAPDTEHGASILRPRTLEPAVARERPSSCTTVGRCARPRPLSAAPLPLSSFTDRPRRKRRARPAGPQRF